MRRYYCSRSDAEEIGLVVGIFLFVVIGISLGFTSEIIFDGFVHDKAHRTDWKKTWGYSRTLPSLKQVNDPTDSGLKVIAYISYKDYYGHTEVLGTLAPFGSFNNKYVKIDTSKKFHVYIPKLGDSGNSIRDPFKAYHDFWPGGAIVLLGVFGNMLFCVLIGIGLCELISGRTLTLSNFKRSESLFGMRKLPAPMVSVLVHTPQGKFVERKIRKE